MAPTPTVDAARAELGRRLREARNAKARSQADVAAAVGTDQKVVSRAERGLTSLETQYRIADELGLDLMGAA